MTLFADFKINAQTIEYKGYGIKNTNVRFKTKNLVKDYKDLMKHINGQEYYIDDSIFALDNAVVSGLPVRLV